LGKLFTRIASPVSQLQETGVQKGSFRRQNLARTHAQTNYELWPPLGVSNQPGFPGCRPTFHVRGSTTGKARLVGDGCQLDRRHCRTVGASRTERSAAWQVGDIVEQTKVLRCESRVYHASLHSQTMHSRPWWNVCI